MIVKNYLLGYKDMYIMQETSMFHFSLDSVLLPNFIKVLPKTKEILDIGCGNAPIPLILSTKTKAHITGVEIQKEVYELAIESVKINNLESQITIVNADIKNYYKQLESDTIDIITCNPPFFKVNETSHLNESDYKTLARHEVSLNLDDICIIAKKLLKNNGKLGLVHRPERLLEILNTMQKHNIEPKRIQFVYPKENKEANIVLVEGMKNGKPGLTLLPPLYTHNDDGSYSDQMLRYFEGR